MLRLKLGLAFLLTVGVIVVALQNTGTVRARLLVATVDAPLAMLVVISVLVGFALGVLASYSASRKKKPGG